MIKSLLFFAQSGEIKEVDKELGAAFFARLYFLKYGVFILYFLTVAFLYGFEIFQGMGNKANDNVFLTFLNFVIMAPVLEELIFRNHLNLKPVNLILSVLIMLYVYWGDGFSFLMFGYFILAWLVKNNKGPKTKLCLIYFSSILFGFAHYYQIIDWSNKETLSMFFLRSFPHVLGGLIYAYLYFRTWGIMAAIFFHAIWNLVPFFKVWMDMVF